MHELSFTALGNSSTIHSTNKKKSTYLKLNFYKRTDPHIEPAVVEVNKVWERKK